MSAPTDFDFMFGEWTVTHRRLADRLVGCTEWVTFTGTSHTSPILGGFGNIEDNSLDLPDGAYRAVAMRSFDEARSEWAIWWLDGRNPTTLDSPVIGGFTDDIGTFYADDTLDGRPIRVRFTWRADQASPRWEQAFSPDGGASWETNWVMNFTR